MHLERRAIRSLADEADQLHHESMRTLRDELGELHLAAARSRRASRRSFLTKVGVGGAAVTLAGAVSPFGGLILPVAAQDDEGGQSEGSVSEERRLAEFVQTLELAAVAAYGLAADRFTALRERDLSSIAEMFGDHHQQHADTIGSNVLVLTDEQAGGVVADPGLVAELAPRINEAEDADAVAEVLRGIEEGAAVTYLDALGVFSDPADAKSAALILPVESQHAVVWAITLGLEPDAYLLTFVAESDAESYAPAAS